MRGGAGKHEAPEFTQDMPADNTNEHVMRQVRIFEVDDALIHPEIAREIAAGWASSGPDGVDFQAFASTGEITDGLAAQIAHVIWKLTQTAYGEHADPNYEREMRALDAYVNEALLQSGRSPV